MVMHDGLYFMFPLLDTVFWTLQIDRYERVIHTHCG